MNNSVKRCLELFPFHGHSTERNGNGNFFDLYCTLLTYGSKCAWVKLSPITLRIFITKQGFIKAPPPQYQQLIKYSQHPLPLQIPQHTAIAPLKKIYKWSTAKPQTADNSGNRGSSYSSKILLMVRSYLGSYQPRQSVYNTVNQC